MRTKTVLLTAALGLVAAATTMAQVYSVNAVGYINLSLAKGFQMGANQLDDKAGNKVSNVLAGVAAGTVIYKFGSAGYSVNAFDPDLGGWDDPNMTLKPGEGAW